MANEAVSEMRLREIGLNGGVRFAGLDKPAILDNHGDPLETQRRPGFMERLDSKASKKIEISQGTAWLLGAAVIIANLAFNYGGSMLSSAREDQSQKEQISVIQATQKEQSAAIQASQAETRSDVKDLNRKFDDLQKMLQDQRVQDAKVEGYRLKSAEGKHDGQ